MLMKGHELNQQLRQDVRDTHTVFNSDMIARGKVERLEGQEVDLIYVRHPRHTNVAARCCKGMGPSIPDRSEFIAFESHIRIDPAMISISATLKACLQLTILMQRTCPVASLPALPSTPMSHQARQEGGSRLKPPCRWTLPDTNVGKPHSGGVLQNIMYGPVNLAPNPKDTKALL
jgi:hypothetical protein